MEYVELPATLNGLIDYGAFENCTSLVRIDFYGDPDYNDIDICENAFLNCSALKYFSLPSRTRTIGKSAFHGCSALEQITIPSRVNWIGVSAFENCVLLENVTFEGGIESIDNYAFNGCKALLSITLPDSVTTLGYYPFWNCDKLESIYLGDNIATIATGITNGNAKLFCDIASTTAKTLTKAGIPFYNADQPDFQLTNVEGTIGLKKYVGKAEDFYIPDFVDEINANAFENCDFLQSLEIPAHVETIRESAFKGCTNLTSVIVHSSRIDSSAFQGCVNLASARINSVSIGSSAFSGCTALQTVSFGDALTTIGDHAFSGASSIAGVTIPSNVQTVGEYAFSDCTGLQNVALYCEQVDDYAFQGCTALQTVSFGNSPMELGAHAFDGASSMRKLTIPSSVQSIGSYVFANCSRLSDVIVHSEQIGSYAFQNCSALTSATLDNATVGSHAFDGCTALSTVTTTNKLTLIDTYAFSGCAALQSISFGNKLMYICDHAFQGCESLEEIDTPARLGDIGAQAFMGCKALRRVSLGGGLLTINESAFRDCTALQQIILPSSVQTLGESAFQNCTALTSAVLSPSITSFGDLAFANCYLLQSLVLPEGIDDSIGKNAFQNCYGLTNVSIPGSVWWVGDYAFKNCTRLASVTIHEGVGYINKYAFDGCNDLRSVYIPDSVKTVDDYAFADCTSLTDVRLSAALTRIHEGAFLNCESLVKIDIPTTVTVVEAYAFQNCTNLLNATLPYGVTEIDGFAFQNCASLLNITIPNSITDIYSGTFMGCTSLTKVAIPSGVVNIYGKAFKDCKQLATIRIPASVKGFGEDIFSGCEEVMLVVDLDSPAEQFAIDQMLFYTDHVPLQLFDVSTCLTDCTIGTTNRWFVNTVGGTERLQYSYRLLKDGAEYKTYSWRYTNGVAFTFTEVGAYTLEATVKDALGETTTPLVSAEVRVTAAALLPAIIEITSENSECDIATSNTWSIEGNESVSSYELVLYCDGNVVESIGSQTKNTVTRTLQTQGAYRLQAIATDKDGHTSAPVMSAPVRVAATTFTYEALGDGTAAINGISRAGLKFVEVPTRIDGLTVSTIRAATFAACDKLQRVVVRDHVTSIEANTFAHCAQPFTMLVDIGSYAESYAKVNSYAVEYNQYPAESISLSATTVYAMPGDRFSLVAAALPQKAGTATIVLTSSNANVVSIGEGGIVQALANGTADVKVATTAGGASTLCHAVVGKLPVLSISAKAKQVESRAFQGAIAVQSVDMSACEGLLVGDRAYDGCVALKRVLLPTNVTMGDMVFNGCDSLVLFCQNDKQAQYAILHDIHYVRYSK